jgi:hypothetical protein
MQRRLRPLSALALASIALLTGCGGDEEPRSATSATTAAADGNTFKAADVGFTFGYPNGFEQVDEPNDGDALATVTPTPGDVKNGLKIRETAKTELEFAAYSGTIRAQFEDQLGVKVALREESEGDLKLGVMEWSKPITFTDLGQEETTQLKSTSYFFAAGGRTWQLECISAAEHREAIDAACTQAIGSISA